MVQEKDAALKRVQRHNDFLTKTKEELEKNTLGFKWYVIEYTPGYNTGGYYDTDVPAKSVQVSEDFNSEEEAEGWMGEHEPDEGKELLVRRKRLIRRIYTEWVDC